MGRVHDDSLARHCGVPTTPCPAALGAVTPSTWICLPGCCALNIRNSRPPRQSPPARHHYSFLARISATMRRPSVRAKSMNCRSQFRTRAVAFNARRAGPTASTWYRLTFSPREAKNRTQLAIRAALRRIIALISYTHIGGWRRNRRSGLRLPVRAGLLLPGAVGCAAAAVTVPRVSGTAVD
jgi:hypothetical protein